MSLSAVLSTASTGLMASQAGLRTVSDNIANVNTPGYVRKVLNQTSLVTGGTGSGVNIDGVSRVIDRYLQVASLNASSSTGRTGVVADFLDRAQGLFGNPTSQNSFFGRLDTMFAEFSALANDPSSSLQRNAAVGAVDSFFAEADRISDSLTAMRGETDVRIRSAVSRANDLLVEIARLNQQITATSVGGGDSSGAENIQAQLVNELATLIDVQQTPRQGGGVTLRANDGMLLAGDAAASLAWNSSDTGAGYLSMSSAGGDGALRFDARFTAGALIGLIETRDREIPAIQAQLAELVGKTAAELNAAHNAHSAVPAPQTLSGRNTGLDLTTAASGFTGTTTVAIVNSANVITRRVAIDFSAGTMSVDGGPTSAFTPATFASSLNTALGAFGAASFANGALSIQAPSGSGVAIQDDATTPAQKAGQGFSQFFGLNDIVRSAGFAPFDTGLSSADAHGFTPGQTITFRISDVSGSRLREVTTTVPAGATMGDLLTALNAPGTGVSPYGSFSLDANGRMTFASTGVAGASVSVVDDSTQRGAGGPSLSSLFGIGPQAQAAAASSFGVNPTVKNDPSKLATAKLNLAAALGAPALALADGQGAFALAGVGEVQAAFAAVGGLPASMMTVSRYATEFAGTLGRRSAAAEASLASDEALAAEAENRRTSFEGVNMDEELVRLTTYQQAFNASARMIQAANELYDVLLAMI